MRTDLNQLTRTGPTVPKAKARVRRTSCKGKGEKNRPVTKARMRTDLNQLTRTGPTVAKTRVRRTGPTVAKARVRRTGPTVARARVRRTGQQLQRTGSTVTKARMRTNLNHLTEINLDMGGIFLIYISLGSKKSIASCFVAV
jgi:hypothetical protein